MLVNSGPSEHVSSFEVVFLSIGGIRTLERIQNSGDRTLVAVSFADLDGLQIKILQRRQTLQHTKFRNLNPRDVARTASATTSETGRVGVEIPDVGE
jgi:hypothetical protein